MWPVVVSLSRMALLGAGLVALISCAREQEAAMRARLAQWFTLGPTLVFVARSDCAAGVYELASADVTSAMPVTGSAEEMLFALGQRGRAALDDRDQPPDAALVVLANAERASGMAMRRIGLEARACMDEATEGAFRAALLDPRALLAFDRDSATLMVMDGGRGLLFAVMGAP